MALRAFAALVFSVMTVGLYGAQEAPAASVPPPKRIQPAALPDPFMWSTELQLRGATLDYKVDLDLIAPLGNGSANAAIYFKDFAKVGGARLNELGELLNRRVPSKTSTGEPTAMVYAPGERLLLEAEPWVDQAVMRFYPQVWLVRGWDTNLPNLLHFMNLGKSWISRGRAQSDPEKMKDDYRRVVRLGRLLKQDDVSLIQDFIGIALIRMGSAALYDVARREQDGVATTITALAIHDSNILRLETQRRTETFGLTEENIDSDGLWATLLGPTVDLTSKHLARIVDAAKGAKERRLRLEALNLLWVIKGEGSSAHVKQASAALEAASNDRDPIIAANARYLQTAKWDKKRLGNLSLR